MYDVDNKDRFVMFKLEPKLNGGCMSVCLFLDDDWGSVLSYIVDRVVKETKIAKTLELDNCGNLLFFRKDNTTLLDDLEYIADQNVNSIMHIILTFKRNGDFIFQNETKIDSTIPLTAKIYTIQVSNSDEAQVIASELIKDIDNFFLIENPKKKFPKIPKIPHCPSLVTDNSTLPPLRNKDGLTDFPTKGEDQDINFKNSKFIMFPFDLTMKIIEEMPEVWCKGGNQFGNRAFDYWIKVMKALHENKPIPNECQRWLKKREGYIARHRKDNRVAGIIAMIKWAGFVDGPGARAKGCEDGSSLDFMLDVIGYNNRIK